MSETNAHGACPVEHGGRMEDCAAYPACGCDFAAPPALTHLAFVRYVARIAQKSSAWAADNADMIQHSDGGDDVDDLYPVHPRAA